MTTAQLIIDPQKDFIKAPDFVGSLAVPGAYEDMLRLCEHIKKTTPDAIFVTLDTHEKIDIAHKAWWVDKHGNPPNDFTQITEESILSGEWKTKNSEEQDYSLWYVQQLKANEKYTLTIWPDHCLKESVGHTVNDELAVVLYNWEKLTGKKVEYIKKGMNPRTEHYSGLKAEVELDDDEATKLNVSLINKLNSYDKIEVSGEAASHCVGSTIIDLLENLPNKDKSKVVLLTNCISPVPGYELQANNFINKVEELGGSLEEVKSINKRPSI